MVYLPPAFTETPQRGADRAYRAPRFRVAREQRRRAASARRTELIASQIPFLVERRDGSMLLQGHIARPNPQVADLDRGGEVLAIFPGPHAYVSPSWYEAGPAVPTWNYASVHAYGTARAIRDPDWLRDMLDRLSARHEAREAAPWRMRDLPEAYLEVDAAGHRRDRDRGQPAGGQIQAEPEPAGRRPAAHHRRARTAGRPDLARGGRADARARDRRRSEERPCAAIPRRTVTFRAPDSPSLVLLLAVLCGAAGARPRRPPGRRKILAFGDSLTAGFGLPSEQGFPAQLEKRLRADGIDVHVINAGVSGDTTAGGLARLDWSLAEKPDLVILELGANDMLRGIDPATVRANLDKMIEQDQGERRQAAARRDAGLAELGRKIPKGMSNTYS